VKATHPGEGNTEREAATSQGERVGARSPVAAIILFFLGLRVLLSLWMWLIPKWVAMPLWPDDKLRPYYGVSVEGRSWLAPWQRWDTLHYQAIAERGYSAFDTALFVPPLLPALMRYGARLVGGNTLLAGLAVSSAAALAAILALYRLCETEMRDSPSARRATLYCALFPTAFFLFAAYTESLFLLAAIMLVWHMRRSEWLRAGAWAAVASLSRLPGALVLVPLSIEAIVAWRASRRVYPMLAMLVGGVGALLFPAYVWVRLGLPPWTPLAVQAARFGGGFAFPGVNLVQAIGNILHGSYFITDALDILFLLVFVALAFPVWRSFPRAYGVYYLTYLLLFLTRTGGSEPLVGTVRYVLALFPAFMVLGRWGANRWAHRAILYSSLIGLLFMSAGFALWLWMG